jgi:hypothetical protein
LIAFDGSSAIAISKGSDSPPGSNSYMGHPSALIVLGPRKVPIIRSAPTLGLASIRSVKRPDPQVHFDFAVWGSTNDREEPTLKLLDISTPCQAIVDSNTPTPTASLTSAVRATI